MKVKLCARPRTSSKKSLLFVQFWAARGFCQRVQNSRICQHCDVKTSTVTPTFYYFFIIFLTCYISVPSFIYNLCQVLLLRNHLNGCKAAQDLSTSGQTKIPRHIHFSILDSYPMQLTIEFSIFLTNFDFKFIRIQTRVFVLQWAESKTKTY